MKQKTYKREFAAFLMLAFLGLTGYFLWTGDENYWEVAQFIFTPTVGFAAMAFGMDSYAKQIKGKV